MGKTRGLIKSVQENLDALREKAGFRLKPELYKQVLDRVG